MSNRPHARLRLCRIVPFDIGNNLSEQHLTFLASCFRGYPEFVDFGSSRSSSRLSDVGLHCRFRSNDLHFETFLFREGIGIFHIEELEQTYESIEDFDPELVNRVKSQGNRAILTRQHCCSPVLDKIINDARSPIGGKALRHTASQEFEYAGLSYVFTYGLLNCPQFADADKLETAVTLCLFPSYSRIDPSEDLSLRIHEYVASIENRLDERRSPEALATLERSSTLMCLASWSSLFVVGNVTPEVENYYKEIEVTLQRIWYFTYIIGKSIDSVALKIHSITLRELLLIEEKLTEMIFRARRLDAIFSSVSTNRDFAVHDGLRKSSRLDRLLGSIELSSRYLIEQIRLRIEQNRLTSTNIIELVLIVLAGTQAFSSYRQISQLGGTLGGWEIATILTLIAIVLVALVRRVRGR